MEEATAVIEKAQVASRAQRAFFGPCKLRGLLLELLLYLSWLYRDMRRNC
jgi:hypothetical protein